MNPFAPANGRAAVLTLVFSWGSGSVGVRGSNPLSSTNDLAPLFLRFPQVRGAFV